MLTPATCFARLRARLALQVTPPLVVSERARQHHFGADAAAYCEIEVRAADGFAVVVVRGGDPGSDGFITRTWLHHADEVWLLDVDDQAITVAPRSGPARVFGRTETVRSARLAGVAIPVAQLFEAAS